MEKTAHTETERKFLVKDCSYKASATESIRMKQGYICRESGRTVRIRIAGDRAWLTIKGCSTEDGLSRMEWETEIGVSDAEMLMTLCGDSESRLTGAEDSGIIDKTRHYVPVGEHIFEVDEFHGANEGLTIAEIELKNESEPFSRPEWLGKEVTGDRRYYNSMLIGHPYSAWEDSAKA